MRVLVLVLALSGAVATRAIERETVCGRQNNKFALEADFGPLV